MFVRNCWYVAAWSSEVGNDPVAYGFLNEPVVLFRTRDGKPAALADRCSHRSYPLSKGKVVGDKIVCGYHGLTYGCDGVCTYVPGQRGEIPSWARVKSYPVAEKFGCVWIWMGDKALADESLVTDISWPAPWGRTGRVLVKANYQLICDNLSDLSHVAYLHSTNIGTPAVAEHGEMETEVSGNMVRVSRWTMDQRAPATYAKAGGFTTNIDRWQLSDFVPPAFYELNFGAAPTGRGRDAINARDRWAFHGRQWGTPETEKTTHWFWAYAHNFGPERDARASQLFFEGSFNAVFGEDFAAIEAQQRALDLAGNAPLMETKADEGIRQARRLVSQLIEAETQPPVQKLSGGVA